MTRTPPALGFALDTKKPEGFIGKKAVLARRARGAPAVAVKSS
jgi:glycine cleavage system aminomethyltransferase T